LVGPPCRRDASAEVDEILFRNVDAEGADRGLFPNYIAMVVFYEKALFVKPTWRPLYGGRNCSVPFALCFYPHFR
jgi:hypothetical protein